MRIIDDAHTVTGDWRTSADDWREWPGSRHHSGIGARARISTTLPGRPMRCLKRNMPRHASGVTLWR